MSINVIGNVPYWDSLYGEPGPQSWWTDGVSLFDDNGTAVAPINSAATQAATGATDSTTMNIISSLPSLIPALASGYSALSLADVNIGRAKAGLPPLNAAAYGPQVGVSLAPATQSLVMYGVAALALVMLLKRS